MPWTISLNNAAGVELKSLGILNPVVRKVALEVGTFAFQIKVADINTACAFTYGMKVVLTTPAGVIFFVGRVRYVEANFDGGSSSWTVTVCDAWWELERTMYRQTAVAYQAAPYTFKTGYLSTRVTLNQDSWGNKVTLGAQITNAMIYAASQNPGIIGSFGVPVYGFAPTEEVNEVSVATLISKACSLTPDKYPVPLYSNGIWQLAFTTRGQAFNNLDLNLGQALLSVTNLKRDDASRPPGIVIDFLRQVVQTAPPAQTVTTLVRQFAGIPGGAGTLYTTITLGPCETVPSNVAAAYWNALQVAQWSGSFKIQQGEIGGQFYPGVTVNFLNGRPEWASMNAVCRACTYELDSGITDVELGPPDILQIDGFVEQMMRWRNFPATQAMCQVNNNGTEGTDEGVDDEGNSVPNPPPNQPDPNNPDAGGQGVSGPASGNAPGGGTPTPNPDAGKPSAAVNTGNDAISVFSTTALTLCDGSQINVLTSTPV
jgi:hypothetical protein